MSGFDLFFFGVYPYICLAVFFLGSLVRFDAGQYSWRSESSQLLDRGHLRWSSNLFHIGVLFLFFGHFFGMLTPHAVYSVVIGAPAKQVLAMVSGGVAGLMAIIGVSMLLARRVNEPHVRRQSHARDYVVLGLFWIQLLLGLATIPLSAQHLDGSMMMVLAHWAQSIVVLQPQPELVAPTSWVFKLHMIVGMTVFLILPFTRLVHIWSGFATLYYAFRPYQVVRSRRIPLPDAAPQPTRRGTGM